MKAPGATLLATVFLLVRSSADVYEPPEPDLNNEQVAIDVAVSDKYPDRLRHRAIYKLRRGKYSEDAAGALLIAAGDAGLNRDARGSAAIGLKLFARNHLPDADRKRVRNRFRSLVERDKRDTPDEVIRALVDWNDAIFVANTLGKELENHPVEIRVLHALPSNVAVPLLVHAFERTPAEPTSKSNNRRADAGRALIWHGDKRGVDVLSTLLSADSVPKMPKTDDGPNHQYRHNVFAVILLALGRNFGYTHLNYDPSIDRAITAFHSWWPANRASADLTDNPRIRKQ